MTNTNNSEQIPLSGEDPSGYLRGATIDDNIKWQLFFIKQLMARKIYTGAVLQKPTVIDTFYCTGNVNSDSLLAICFKMVLYPDICNLFAEQLMNLRHELYHKN